jgi:hypothetical protein
VAQLVGLPGVDPNQSSLPDWEGGMDEAAYEPWDALLGAAESLPAYLFDADSRAELQIALRLRALQAPA